MVDSRMVNGVLPMLTTCWTALSRIVEPVMFSAADALEKITLLAAGPLLP